MEKKENGVKYISPKLDIIGFTCDDVIATSTCTSHSACTGEKPGLDLLDDIS